MGQDEADRAIPVGDARCLRLQHLVGGDGHIVQVPRIVRAGKSKFAR